MAALTAAGVTVGGGSVLLSTADIQLNPGEDADADADQPIDDATLSTLVAASEVLYPSEIENSREFVTQYIRGRARDDPDYATEIVNTVAYLDQYSLSWYRKQFRSLDVSTRDDVFREMNADTATPAPDGSDVERVRYYIINELLFALYTSPTGGALVGLENPQGHPGGLGSYQQGPESQS